MRSGRSLPLTLLPIPFREWWMTLLGAAFAQSEIGADPDDVDRFAHAARRDSAMSMSTSTC